MAARKRGVAGRTAAALADSAKDRATIAARKTRAKILGHRFHCPDCGRTASSGDRVAACRDKHKRAPKARTGPARSKTGPNRGNPIGSGWGKARAPDRKFVGREHFSVAGKRVHNRLEFNDEGRQHAEREKRAEERRQERARRTQAVNGRADRNGKPKGTPKARPVRVRDDRTSAERKAAWKAQRMQMAAGRMDRAGTRIPHEPSPRKVQPRQRVAPKVR